MGLMSAVPAGLTAVGPSHPILKDWAMCDDKAMRLTGERPSADVMWKVCVAEGNCAVARQSGEQPEANNPAQNSISMRLNSIRPVRQRPACIAKVKPVAQAMLMASPPHVKVTTSRNGRVIGVSGVGKYHRQSHETCAGARRERCRSQSPHSSDEAGNDRGAKGDRKVKA